MLALYSSSPSRRRLLVPRVKQGKRHGMLLKDMFSALWPHIYTMICTNRSIPSITVSHTRPPTPEASVSDPLYSDRRERVRKKHYCPFHRHPMTQNQKSMRSMFVVSTRTHTRKTPWNYPQQKDWTDRWLSVLTT